jgi:hypothetical protein
METPLPRPSSAMTRLPIFSLACLWIAVPSLVEADVVADRFEKEIKPLLGNYCFDCHADGTAKGDFSMDKYADLSSHLRDQKHWLAVWTNVRSQIMPPSDKDQLEIDEKKMLLAWIEKDVFKLDPSNPDPGRVTIRRLNRNEYRNAVYDLLGVEYDTRDVFPPDDTGHGFDNIGDVLSISPLLMEKYIAASEEVVDLALPKGSAAQVPRVDIEGPSFKNPSDPKTDATWLSFNDGTTVKFSPDVQWDGKYQITVNYSIHGATEATDHSAEMTLNAGGKEIGRTSIGWDPRRVIQLSGEVDFTKGSVPLEISISPRKSAAEDQEELYLRIQRVTILGPLGGSEKEYAKGYRMIFVDGEPPESSTARDAYARKIMRSFVSRAFRRPLDSPTIDRLVAMVREIAATPGKDFQDGIKQAIATCLASPRFLFRIEIQPEPNNPARIVPLDEYALAARLSFFLWSSVPDDELLSLAFNNKLRANLREQVDRMLADPRSSRLTENFVGQWLQSRDIDTIPVSAKDILKTSSSQEAAHVFDPRLRSDMRKESEGLFDFILHKGRPAEELISAHYSVLNERLAKFYGIEGVEGEEFRPVDLLAHPERGGILTQGSFLIVTSNPTRTSPVKRGLFVLDNLLGTPAPPAPPNVPPLEKAAASTPSNPTMREMMEIHRSNPDCRGCHARMDPIGLGLENYNAIGQFRLQQDGKKIDASGKLLTGEKFSDIAALKTTLAQSRKLDFYRCLSEKLLTFAIGRGVEYYDAPTIDSLVAHLEKNEGKLSELIHAITESAPFQKRRGGQ